MEINDVSYILQEIKEMEKLSSQQLKKLQNLKVTLRHKVLPQHEIESRAGSRPLTCKEMQQFEGIIPIKKGMFNAAEDKIIFENWKSFCKLHNWDRNVVKPFINLREDNKSYIRSKIQRRKFVQFLADGLPNRTLYSVYHRFRNIFHDHVCRRFNPEEDQMILNHLENNGSFDGQHKFADLAKVLKRSRLSVWRRYQKLKKKRSVSNNEANITNPRYMIE